MSDKIERLLEEIRNEARSNNTMLEDCNSNLVFIGDVLERIEKILSKSTGVKQKSKRRRGA